MKIATQIVPSQTDQHYERLLPQQRLEVLNNPNLAANYDSRIPKEPSETFVDAQRHERELKEAQQLRGY